MSTTLTAPMPPAPAIRPPAPRWKKPASGWGDKIFKNLTLTFALSILGIALGIAYELFRNSSLARHAFGWAFLGKQIWDPVAENFGALPFIYGTLVSSFLALIIAVPLGIGVAIFLAELAPRRVSDVCSFLVELLAAIPSVVYGLIGIFVLVPFMRVHLQPLLMKLLGWTPLFKGPAYGVGMLTAGIVLAIMIVPFIATISREVLLSVPLPLKESAMALGATHWEVVRLAVLPYARSGIIGSIFLGLGRALGETMAVTMVIGNRPEIAASLLAPGYTMAAVLANEFTEATSDLYVHTLIEIGLVLFMITIIVNGAARLILLRMNADPAAMMTYDRYRKFYNTMAFTVTALCAGITLMVLFFVLGYVTVHGISSLSWDFFTKLPTPVGESGGGMANAIVGTMKLVFLAAVLGLPVGVMGGIYLAEYGLGNRLGFFVRFAADVINGVPSIVMGIFAYTIVVLPMKHFSALAGGVALAIMLIPIAVRSTEEFLKLVPRAVRESALALGLPQWKVITMVVIPTAFRGLLTGVLLNLSRVSGETAPLLFTAFGNRYWSSGWMNPISSLPVMIFTYAVSPYEDWHRQAWAAALVLMLLVLVTNIGARLIMRRSIAVS